MKKKLIGIIVLIIIGGILGFFACYIIYDGKQIKQTIKKEVTVNENGIADGIEAIYKAVVTVENHQFSKIYSIGSGFVYDKKGLIITNYHVVDGATEIKVILANGDAITAKYIGGDAYADIAVLEIDAKYILDVAKIGDNTKTRIGDTVFAIGSSVSLEYAGTVTRGVLSGKNRMVNVSSGLFGTNNWIMNVMQTDAAINPGNSGGPLCNVNGEVIGVCNMKIVQNSTESLGFAIPIEDAIKWANKIVNNEEIKRPFLGIEMQNIASLSTDYLRKEKISNNIKSGVFVANVLDDTPAKKAGIKNSDVIVKFNNNEIDNVAQLRYYLYQHEPGDIINLTIIRKETEKTIKITLGEQ